MSSLAEAISAIINEERTLVAHYLFCVTPLVNMVTTIMCKLVFQSGTIVLVQQHNYCSDGDGDTTM